jgi:hypothetical protein
MRAMLHGQGTRRGDDSGPVRKAFIPAPDPDDIKDTLVGESIDASASAAGAANENAEKDISKIKSAGRIGPSRAKRIAKLENDAQDAGRATKVFKGAGYGYSAYQAAQNALVYCAK